MDQTGKGIANATVELKGEAGATSRSVTDTAGKFTAKDIPAGTYTIVASAEGFSKATRPGGQVIAGATLDVPITLTVESVLTEVTVSDSVSLAESLAPSGNTLEAVSAKTEISGEFIKNFMSPTADYAEVVNYAPGTFSLNPNGIGLGQGKTYFRGFPDGDYTMTFDGIPFEDTNSPTHHSWANFPSGWTAYPPISTAARAWPQLSAPPTSAGRSICSRRNCFRTRTFAHPYRTARGIHVCSNWTPTPVSLGRREIWLSLLMDIQQLLSDGYQTFNYQKRVAGYGKYQYLVSPTAHLLRLYGGLSGHLDQPISQFEPTRRAGKVAQFGDNYLLYQHPEQPSGQPDPLLLRAQLLCTVRTDFEYAVLTLRTWGMGGSSTHEKPTPLAIGTNRTLRIAGWPQLMYGQPQRPP